MTITTAKYCDRWDLIAYDLMGDAALAPVLMAANPKFVTIYQNHLPEGVEIIIPEQSALSERITQIRAPWKRD